MNKRVVITGIGAITPKNMNSDFAEALFATENLGVQKIESEIEDFLTKAEELIPYNTIRRTCRFSILALYSNILAAKDSGIVIDSSNEGAIGSIMNTIYGPLKVTENFLNTLIKSGPQNVSPADFANTVINCATGQVSIFLKIKGASSTLVGSSALTYAYDLIRHQKATGLFVSGIEEYHPNVEKNYSPDTILSESSVCLFLEEYEHAKARNAKIYGEIIACGIGTNYEPCASFDSNNGKGLEGSITSALSSIDTSNSDGYLISASPRALSEMHSNEYRIAKSHLNVTHVCPWKDIFGETLGSNELLAAAIGAISLKENKFLFFDHKYCTMPLTEEALIISNSYQPGGCWSTILMKRVNE